VTTGLSDQEHDLAHENQSATVVQMGAGIRFYRYGSRDIVDGYGRDEAASGSRGQLLIPWPNRIADGRYTFAGRDLQLPVNEPATGSAIHGLTRWMSWRFVDAGADRCALALDLEPQDGYPFTLGLEVVYVLDSAGLTTRLTATNHGTEACPYGAGAHPYVQVAADALIDDAVLQVPANMTLAADARGIPTGVAMPVDGTPFDFRAARRVGATVLDTAFTDLQTDRDGLTRISLTSSARDAGATVWMDRTMRFAMIYSGDTLASVSRRRRSIAIEPMTCAPDAFNSGAGLVILEPGASHTSTWGITPI
jgi:aldose 1-epimerase